MSFGSWLKRVFSAKQSEDVTEALNEEVAVATSEEDEEAAGLNFRSAIEAHQKWKVRLQSALDNDTAHELSVNDLCRDDLCVLGKWIHGNGGDQFGSEELFQKLQSDHAQFHKCAGSVLETLQSGDEGCKQKAQDELNGGQYVTASQDVIMDLAQLYHTVSAK